MGTVALANPSSRVRIPVHYARINTRTSLEAGVRGAAAVAESSVRMVVVDVARDAKKNVESMMREIEGKGEAERKGKMGESCLEGKENTKKSQLEGEVLVVLNKSDLVSKEQVEEVREFVLNKYPFVQSKCGSMMI